MPGIPQVRESAWLYEPADPHVPTAHVRLEERADGEGWDLYLADPASGPTEHARYATESEARAVLERVYADGRKRGEWRVHRPSGY